jgi:hypothetical protein
MRAKRTSRLSARTSEFDPKATLAVHCGNGFDTLFRSLSKLSFQAVRCHLLSLGVDV